MLAVPCEGAPMREGGVVGRPHCRHKKSRHAFLQDSSNSVKRSKALHAPSPWCATHLHDSMYRYPLRVELPPICNIP